MNFENDKCCEDMSKGVVKIVIVITVMFYWARIVLVNQNRVWESNKGFGWRWQEDGYT